MTRLSGSKEKQDRAALLDLENTWSMWITADQLPYRIGRHPNNDLVISSTAVSRRHCQLIAKGGGISIEDTDSYHGTVVSDQLIKNDISEIKERCCILLGDTMLWVTPCNEWGEPLGSSQKVPSDDSRETHGICLVDICNS